jgi:signal transduction histidine kinase
MLLSHLFKTSSFRIVLLASAVFCIALLLLSNFVLTTTVEVMMKQNDLTVKGEIGEILNDSKGEMTQLIATVTRMSKTSPQFFYALQNQDGGYLAGNLPTAYPLIGPHDWMGPQLKAGEENPSIHGLGIRTIEDAYLFVGLRSFKAVQLYATLTHYFLWIMALTFLALLLGGLTISSRILRRIETISQTSRDIVSGDLKRRVPVSGTADEFDHLALSLNVMLDRIQDLMEGLRQVSSDIAHDLRTPLSRLRQGLETARFKATTVEELRCSVDQSIEHVDSILAIFSSLLRIAQIESGIRRSGFKRLDLAEILRKIVDLYKPVINDKMQILIPAISSDLMIVGDRELLTQLLVNLIDNATHHTPTQSVITVKGFIEGEYVVAEIADNGPGIPEPLRSKVLQRFYRLEQSRSTPGHGLGLSLVDAVSEQHSGKLELRDNDPGLLIRFSLKYEPLDRELALCASE